MENSTTTPSYSGTTGADGQPVMEQAKEQARHVVDQTKQAAGQMMGQAKDQVKSQISTQKDRAADSLHTLADAFRQTGQQMQGQEQAAMVTGLTDRAAEMIEGASSFLREREFEDLVGEVENFARREPAIFLGSAFALGFLAARFLKSSTPRSTYGEYYAMDRTHRDYQGTLRRGERYDEDFRWRARQRMERDRLGTAYDRAAERADGIGAAGTYPTYGVSNPPMPAEAYVSSTYVEDDTMDEGTDTGFQTTGGARTTSNG